MPINEAGGTGRSNLTKEQKREAEAAIYGLSTNDMSPQFSHDDIERMRAMVAQHDQTSGSGRVKEFDLNNPAKVPAGDPNFPRIMYHHGKRTHRKAHNAAEVEDALEMGWSKEPYPSEIPEEVELDPEEAAEVARLDKAAKKAKKASE